ncbi:hypothetical protein D0466_14820 [Peribacillus glennii]|uniref:Uncharacterized protein n=1 Tax=Peribacillus glennii TaxID=2303991 RepID=A0A372LAV3_9BACI|nr:hypothetical protein D0466_14820 [Peribacillus glennii]
MWRNPASHLLLRLKSGNTDLAERAYRFGVKVYQTSKYWLNKDGRSSSVYQAGVWGLEGKRNR